MYIKIFYNIINLNLHKTKNRNHWLILLDLGLNTTHTALYNYPFTTFLFTSSYCLKNMSTMTKVYSLNKSIWICALVPRRKEKKKYIYKFWLHIAMEVQTRSELLDYAPHYCKTENEKFHQLWLRIMETPAYNILGEKSLC